MEQWEAIEEGEWSGMVSEEAEFMSQFLRNCSLPNEDSNFDALWVTNANCEDAMHAGGMSGGVAFPSFPNSEEESYHSTFSHHDNNLMMMRMGGFQLQLDHHHTSNVIMGGDCFLNRDIDIDGSNDDSRESNNEVTPPVPIPAAAADQFIPKMMMITSPSDSKKRSSLPCDIPRNKKSIKCSKDDNVNDNGNKKKKRQSSSSCYCSEDEYSNGTTSCSTSSISRGSTRAPNPSGKTRASRGSATDPQSLYARKRRERINERLKVLQTLVPNGTKVDISTMLEEAVEYVKFLQLQIKLLSSDDLWMYSPIAYNGMNIGLDLRISSTTTLPQSS